MDDPKVLEAVLAVIERGYGDGYKDDPYAQGDSRDDDTVEQRRREVDEDDDFDDDDDDDFIEDDDDDYDEYED